jgi:hypothetical protein
MLPLTSTTQTKSIGGLSIFFNAFFVLIYNTAGIYFPDLIGFLSGFSFMFRFWTISSAVISLEITY